MSPAVASDKTAAGLAAIDDGFLIGVDIGGTFTDTILVDPSGRATIGKASSTPPDFERGFMDSIASAAERNGLGVEELLGSAREILHGCTVGTNALVESRTATVGLLTTKGMRDTLFIMQGGARLWGSSPDYIANVAGQVKPPPLIPKQLVAEIDERVTWDGNVLVELNEDVCRVEIQRLLDAGVEAFAVSLLWSVVNPVHEQRVVELVREVAGDKFVTASSEVIARRGDYPRTVATVINALIGPAMNGYLGDLTRQLRRRGYRGQLHVMTCTGGLIDADYARALPVLTVGSGPVAGLIGADSLARSYAARASDQNQAVNVITADMGGTTFDVGLIRSGKLPARPTTSYGEYHYFLPTLDVRSVGSGGGSIVWFDAASGTLRVGPASAGAVPGPAAYGRGGTEPTVTDADLVLGYLNADYFLGGAIELSEDAAREALSRVGANLGLDADETAAAAVRIVDNQMADAIRFASIQQGYDPREYAMYAYGGAGPVHGSAVARQLGMKRLLVPLSDLASGWSASGVASADVLVVKELPRVLSHPFDVAQLNAGWEELERGVAELMSRQGIPLEHVVMERVADMRYAAQVNDVSVVAPSGTYDAERVEALIAGFEGEYTRLYGPSGYAQVGYTLTTMRVLGRVRRDLDIALPDGGGASARAARPSVTRAVIYYEHDNQRVDTPVYDGADLAAGTSFQGPAIVEFVDTTLVVRPGQAMTVDDRGSLSIEL